MKCRKKVILTVVLSMALIFTQVIPVLADGDNLDEIAVKCEKLSDTSEEELKQEEIGEDIITEEDSVDASTPLEKMQNQAEDKEKDDSKEAETDETTSAVDNATTIADGTYKPETFVATGGTGKVKITCPKITIRDGKAYGTIVFSSPYYTRLKASGHVYNGTISQSKGTSTYKIPIALNTENTMIGTTTAMSEAHDITYTIFATLTASSEQLPDDDGSAGDDDSEKPGGDSAGDDVPADKLADGTYMVRADTDNRMFYLMPDSKNQKTAYLVKKNGKMTVTITLTGRGYDYLYMGTTEEAEKAKPSSWSKFHTISGYYTYNYTFDISKLDTKLQIAAHSKNRDKWYQHTIIFYSKGAVKVNSNKPYVPSTGKDKDKEQNTQTKPVKNDHKKDQVSKSSADSSKSTSVVNNATNLKDGVYTPDKFSWSGGSGRLAYIICNKITVVDGKAYATIIFGSSGYDLVKASGRTYSKSGGGLSTFVIPIKLNANNTIVGRTVAMSQPHWITYSIYVYSSAAAAAGDGGSAGKTDTVKKSSLSEKAPEIVGLEYQSTTKVKYAKYFKIYNYDDGVRLLQMDVTENSGLSYQSSDQSAAEEKIQYDDEGKPIAKSQNEITEALYHNKVVNYLLVSEDAEIPAGLDKDFIIVRLPADQTYVSAKESLDFMDQLDATDNILTVGLAKDKVKISSMITAMKKEKITYAGSYHKPDYKVLIKKQIKLAILPGTAIPAEVKESDVKGLFQSGKLKELKEKSKKQKEQLEKLEKRYTTLGIPVIIDRSGDEEKELAKAEWIKVYGALFGCQKEAGTIFDKFVKESKK